MISKILFVEGEEDKKLLLSTSRSCNTSVEVKCDPRGKGNAINSFVAALKLQTSASKNRIGLVVDADFLQHGGGFIATQASINQRLQEVGWNPLSQTPFSGFSTTCNKAKDAQAGVWIMPDNLNDGYVENLVIQSISPQQQPLSNYAIQQTTVAMTGGNGIPPIPTRPHHLDKAKVGTWLAWNDPPRMSLGAAHSNNLLNFNVGLGSDLSNWIKWLYL